MTADYSQETLRLGRMSFQELYKRQPSDAELIEYIDTFLELGLALLK